MNLGAPHLTARRFVLNPQFREDFARFVKDDLARRRAFRLTLVAGAVLLLTWPPDSVLALQTGSLTYPAVGSVVLVLTAYQGLILGIRYRPGGGAHRVQEWAAFVPLPPHSFMLGTAAGRMGDVLLFPFLTIPLLISAAALQGAGADQIAAGLIVVVVTAVTTRLAAICLQLYLEHHPLILFACAHSILIGLFVAGGLFWPPLSPISAFEQTDMPGTVTIVDWLVRPWPGFLATHGSLWVVMYGMGYARVRALRRRAEKSVPGPA